MCEQGLQCLEPVTGDIAFRFNRGNASPETVQFREEAGLALFVRCAITGIGLMCTPQGTSDSIV